jgi:hypothetical protein
MNKLGLYIKLCYLFLISLFVPGEIMRKKIDQTLAEVRGDWAPNKGQDPGA